MHLTMRPYDYAKREGIHELSWTDVEALSIELAEALDREGIDSIIGVARAGLFPATAVALALRRELFVVRLSRRVDDEVVYESPRWRVPIPPEVADRNVAIIDDVADTGETLRLVTAAAREAGAKHIVTAALVAHSWAEPLPTHAPLITDAFVIFPWVRQVRVNGQWQPHPELTAALDAIAEQEED